MQKPWWRKTQTDANAIECKKYKMAFETILEFIQLMPDEVFWNPEKPNYTTEDYTLKQFHWWISRRIEETNPVHNTWWAR